MITAIISALIIYFGAPLIEVWIWNEVLVELFSISTISYLQMFAIHVFCSLLFGGMNVSWSDD